MFQGFKQAWLGLQRLRRLGGKQGPTGDDLTAGGWNTIWGTDVTRATDSIWEDMSVEEREKAYRNLDVVFACVREICTTFSEPPLILGYEAEEGFETLDAHPMLSLLEKPNPLYTREKSEYYQVARLLLTGETFIWKWRNSMGGVAELWPVPTSWCKVKPNKEKGNPIVGYTVRQVTERGHKYDMPVPYEDIMYEWLVDPSNTTRGVGCLQAAQHAYQMETERESLIAEQLKHAHIPGLVIDTPEGVAMDPEAKRYLRDQLYDKVGKGKRGEPLILSGGAKASTLSIMKDLDMPGLAAMDETRLCAAFGVPPIIVGVRAGLENAPWSKYSEARKSFYQETMMPLWTAMQAFYTQSLLRIETEDRLEFRYDTSKLPALQPDRKEQAEIAAVGLKTGGITRNEFRAELGLDPTPDGEVYLMPINLIEQPVRETVKEPEEPEEPELEEAA